MKPYSMPIWGKGGELLLDAKGISVYYGHVKAVEDISFNVGQGEIVAMIGPNGAGKSTALKAVFGMVDIHSGDIFFDGKSVIKLRPDEHVQKGISLLPEGRRLFPSMTVIENLEMGAFFRKDGDIKDEVEKILDLFPALKERSRKKAGVLSTGEQQMLAMGRALMQKPRLLLADEPSIGLSPSYVDRIFEKLVEINKSGTSVLLVEQNAHMALEIANRGYVFKMGNIVLENTCDNLLGNKEVKNTFLGG